MKRVKAIPGYVCIIISNDILFFPYLFYYFLSFLFLSLSEI